jgi:hypothetical protein
MAKGIGLILIGLAFFALSRPYMEIMVEGDVPPPAPKRWPLMRRAVHFGKRSGAHLRLGVGQLIGLAGMIAGLIVVLHSV